MEEAHIKQSQRRRERRPQQLLDTRSFPHPNSPTSPWVGSLLALLLLVVRLVHPVLLLDLQQQRECSQPWVDVLQPVCSNQRIVSFLLALGTG